MLVGLLVSALAVAAADAPVPPADEALAMKPVVVRGRPPYDLGMFLVIKSKTRPKGSTAKPIEEPLIDHVRPNTAAERLGIKQGDRIVEIAGEKMDDQSRFHEGFLKLLTGDTIAVKIRSKETGQIRDVVFTRPKPIVQEPLSTENKP